MCHINFLIQTQVNSILHHADFQRLEASWQGLYFLVQKLPQTPSQLVLIRLLCLSEYELKADVDGFNDFDQSHLFTKIYSDEYDQPGGKPFGLLIADYFVDLGGHIDWMSCLAALGSIASAAFAPLLISVSPRFFGLEHFAALNADIDLARTFVQALYQRWEALRNHEQARFISAIVPRVMWRKPYRNLLSDQGFCESIEGMDDYLWGSPAYIVGAMIISSYIDTKWFIQLREQEVDLSPLYFSMDTQSLMPVGRLDASWSGFMEQDLAAYGFMALIESAYRYTLELHSARSIYNIVSDTDDSVNKDVVVSTMVPYLLCICRFAHYLKIIGRNRIGGFSSAAELEKYLQDWIHHYCGHSDAANLNQLIKYPLKEAFIQVTEDSHQSGNYLCNLDIRPNYHIEKINTRLRFVTNIGGADVS
jgi:type VI secretion system ImpC/EvpB family protein